jgi:hypothetical protein
LVADEVASEADVDALGMRQRERFARRDARYRRSLLRPRFLLALFPSAFEALHRHQAQNCKYSRYYSKRYTPFL